MASLVNNSEFEQSQEALYNAVKSAYSVLGGEKIAIERFVLTCIRRHLDGSTTDELSRNLMEDDFSINEPIDVVSPYSSDICICPEGNHRAYSAILARYHCGYVHAQLSRMPQNIPFNAESMQMIVHYISKRQPIQNGVTFLDRIKGLKRSIYLHNSSERRFQNRMSASNNLNDTSYDLSRQINMGKLIYGKKFKPSKLLQETELIYLSGSHGTCSITW